MLDNLTDCTNIMRVPNMVSDLDLHMVIRSSEI